MISYNQLKVIARIVLLIRVIPDTSDTTLAYPESSQDAASFPRSLFRLHAAGFRHLPQGVRDGLDVDPLFY